MKTLFQNAVILTCAAFFLFVSCQKENSPQPQTEEQYLSANLNAQGQTPPFHLEVILRGEGKRFGHIKFRQDNDPEKIIILDTWVRDLAPNHDYLLQRAVDTNLDGICTSTSWLTLGRGLVPQAITTDAKGTGREILWRNISAVATGATFDIHFRVLDAVTMAVVLTSDCYRYVVR